MRTTLLVCVAAVLAALALSRSAPEPPDGGGALVTTLVVPSEVYVGERVVVFASAALSTATNLDLRLRVCAIATGECRASGWGSVDGPAEWSGTAGVLEAWQPGRYAVTWSLHAPWAPDAHRAVAHVELEVTAVAAPD